mgnify:CR=1 FL=1
MKTILYLSALICAFTVQAVQSQEITNVDDFTKVIISPHIESKFVKGEKNSVEILSNTESKDKVNIQVKGKTLRVYLDDAKETTKTKTVMKNGMKMKVPIYKERVLSVLITYVDLSELSLRGEQNTLCESPITTDKFNLKIYGASEVVFNEVDFDEIDVDIYGESDLTILDGKIDYQKITVYGESKINLLNVENIESKLKAFGEAEFDVNVSEAIKFTSYGEAVLRYKGNAQVNTGLSLGDSEIINIDFP